MTSVRHEYGDEDLNMEVSSPMWITGEIELLQQIVQRALVDLGIPEEREGAIAWLTDMRATENDAWTLPWVCSFLSLDLSAVRSKVWGFIEMPVLTKDGNPHKLRWYSHFQPERRRIQ